MLPSSVQNLIKELSKLPGIGMKTAARLTFYLLNQNKKRIKNLGEAVLDLKKGLKRCKRCFNISEDELCLVCQDDERNQSKICVVETPLDVVAIEKGNEYNGLYHILGGSISPVDGIGPEQLRISDLLDRIKNDNKIKEIIIATNPDLEGEATAMYLKKKISQLEDRDLNVTRIAKGIPIGGDLEYADEITIKQAFEGRQQMKEE